MDVRDALPFCWGVPLTLKSLRPKDYSESPKTMGEHLKKRRKKLGLLQREAAEQMGILTETYTNWEKDQDRARGGLFPAGAGVPWLRP